MLTPRVTLPQIIEPKALSSQQVLPSVFQHLYATDWDNICTAVLDGKEQVLRGYIPGANLYQLEDGRWVIDGLPSLHWLMRSLPETLGRGLVDLLANRARAKNEPVGAALYQFLRASEPYQHRRGDLTWALLEGGCAFTREQGGELVLLAARSGDEASVKALVKFGAQHQLGSLLPDRLPGICDKKAHFCASSLRTLLAAGLIQSAWQDSDPQGKIPSLMAEQFLPYALALGDETMADWAERHLDHETCFDPVPYLMFFPDASEPGKQRLLHRFHRYLQDVPGAQQAVIDSFHEILPSSATTPESMVADLSMLARRLQALLEMGSQAWLTSRSFDSVAEGLLRHCLCAVITVWSRPSSFLYMEQRCQEERLVRCAYEISITLSGRESTPGRQEHISHLLALCQQMEWLGVGRTERFNYLKRMLDWQKASLVKD